jgi:chromosomal replication initiator protein
MVYSTATTIPSQDQSLWTRAENALRQHLPEEEYDDWFDEVRLLECNGSNVMLGVPSSYRKEYIEQNYIQLLSNVFCGLLNQDQLDVAVSLIEPGADNEIAEVKHNAAPATSMPTSQADYEPLNEKYTFESFVVGPSNKMAHAAAEAVAHKPAQSYNPLFLYGGVGLGKTHLMQAIGNAVNLNHPDKRVAYLSAEQFVNMFIDAIKRNARLSFQAVFRNVDVLLIDDIQFLAGKESTQEEFFHTFNALHNRRKQIVISSDRPPKDIPTIEDRLRSRFEWGLIVDIGVPDFETRMAILRRKSEQLHINVPDDVLKYVASKVSSSIREMEGALFKVSAHSRFSGEGLDVETAAELLGEIYDRPVKEISIEKIQRKVAEYYGIKPSDIIGKNRSRSIARPRQVAMYLSRKLTQHSYPEIGTFFGNKDHTTVLFACNKIEKEVELDSKLRSIVEQLTESFSKY